MDNNDPPEALLPADFFVASSCPAKAGIQYAVTFQINRLCRGILDHPPSRMMTVAACGIERKSLKL
jgi:hypothetical protein